jgi:hypothetical protein
MVPYPAVDSTKPYIAPGVGPVARIFFHVATNAPDEVAFVDSAFYFKGGSLDARGELSTYNGVPIFPLIVPGVVRIGEPGAADLTVSPLSFTLAGNSGTQLPVIAHLSIQSSTEIETDWSATWSSDWLTVTPPAGKTPAFPSVKADGFLLAPGIYNDIIEITSQLSHGEPVLVSVTFVVDTPIVETPQEEPATLMQNRPSPYVAYSDPETKIPFALKRPTHVEIAIYDILGRRIRTLVSREYGEGEASVIWDGRDAEGVTVASGRYICRMKTASGESSRMIVLIR